MTMDKYKKIIQTSKSIISELKNRDKNTKSIDRARSNIQIEILKHEIHCICVELWIAELEEYRYWEKHRRIDDFHENMVLFRRPEAT